MNCMKLKDTSIETDMLWRLFWAKFVLEIRHNGCLPIIEVIEGIYSLF